MKSYKEQNNQAKEFRQAHEGPEEIKGHPKRRHRRCSHLWVVEHYFDWFTRTRDAQWYVMHECETEEHANKMLAKELRSIHGDNPDHWRIRKIG